MISEGFVLLITGSSHRSQILVQPGQGLLDVLGPWRDVVGLVEDEAFVLIRGSQEIEHGSDPLINIDVVHPVQHQGRDPDPGHVVDLIGLGPAPQSQTSPHQDAGTEALLHRWYNGTERTTPAHSVECELAAVDIRPGFQVVDASPEILDHLDE